MAITSLWHIKGRLKDLIDYVENPEKTILYENGNISVRFKFADELRKIVEYIELNTEATTALAV